MPISGSDDLKAIGEYDSLNVQDSVERPSVLDGPPACRIQQASETAWVVFVQLDPPISALPEGAANHAEERG